MQETEEGLSVLIESPRVSSDPPNTGSGRPEEDGGVDYTSACDWTCGKLKHCLEEL